jgi:hypothetical protein
MTDDQLKQLIESNAKSIVALSDAMATGHWYRLARSYKRFNTRGSRNQANLE